MYTHVKQRKKTAAKRVPSCYSLFGINYLEATIDDLDYASKRAIF